MSSRSRVDLPPLFIARIEFSSNWEGQPEAEQLVATSGSIKMWRRVLAAQRTAARYAHPEAISTRLGIPSRVPLQVSVEKWIRLHKKEDIPSDGFCRKLQCLPHGEKIQPSSSACADHMDHFCSPLARRKKNSPVDLQFDDDVDFTRRCNLNLVRASWVHSSGSLRDDTRLQ